MSNANLIATLSPAQRELMELAARLFQRLGLPRSTGQVYGLLFTSARPLTLDEIAEALAISKTSASTGTRQLLQLHLLRQVWLPGERRDHFEAKADLREALRANYHSFIKPRLDRASAELDGVHRQLDTDLEQGHLSSDAHATARARLQSLQELHRKFAGLLPLAEKLL